MPEAQATAAVKQKAPAGPKKASKADIKKIAQEMFGDEVTAFHEQVDEKVKKLEGALEARLVEEAKAAEAREAVSRREYEKHLTRLTAAQGLVPDLRAITDPIRKEHQALAAEMDRLQGELSRIRTVAKEALAAAEKAGREASAQGAVASTREIHLAEAVERAKSLLAGLEKGAQERLETQIAEALRKLSGAEERANEKFSVGLDRLKKHITQVAQAESAMNQTTQELRAEMKGLSGRFDAFLVGAQFLGK